MEPKTLDRPLSLGIFLANVLVKRPTRISRLDFHFGTSLVERFLFVFILVAAHFLFDKIVRNVAGLHVSQTPDGAAHPQRKCEIQ